METKIQTLQPQIKLAGFQTAALETLSISRKFLSTEEREVMESFTGSSTIGILIDELGDISDLFRQSYLICMTVSGIRLPSDSDKPAIDQVTEKFLFDYITKHYSNFTFAEIERAFYYNSVDKLDIRHEHFQLFDTTFVSKVLQSWLILKTKTRQRAAALLPPPEPEKPITPEESFNGLKSFYDRNQSFPEFWAWSLVYDHMMEQGMIVESKDERWDMFYAEMERLEGKLELDILNVKDTLDMNKRRELMPEIAKQNCIKKLVQKHFPF